LYTRGADGACLTSYPVDKLLEQRDDRHRRMEIFQASVQFAIIRLRAQRVSVAGFGERTYMASMVTRACHLAGHTVLRFVDAGGGRCGGHVGRLRLDVCRWL
jgi:hypothetical protein